MSSKSRSVGSVFGGLAAVFLITTVTDVILHATGVFPPWTQRMADALFLVALAYRVVYGIVGGYVTARLAPERPVTHALALGIAGVAASVAGTVVQLANPDMGPLWYPLVLILIAIPTAWVGGKIRGRQLASV